MMDPERRVSCLALRHSLITHESQPSLWPGILRQDRDAMGVSTGPRLSGMQKQVLSLYRAFLRAARSKSSEDRKHIEFLVSAEFRRNSHLVDRKNFLYIEYLLRRGRKQLDQLKNRHTVGLTSLHISLSQADKPKR